MDERTEDRALTSWRVRVLSVFGASSGVDPECPGDEEWPTEISSADTADGSVASGAGLADAPNTALGHVGSVRTAGVRGGIACPGKEYT